MYHIVTCLIDFLRIYFVISKVQRIWSICWGGNSDFVFVFSWIILVITYCKQISNFYLFHTRTYQCTMSFFNECAFLSFYPHIILISKSNISWQECFNGSVKIIRVIKKVRFYLDWFLTYATLEIRINDYQFLLSNQICSNFLIFSYHLNIFCNRWKCR